MDAPQARDRTRLSPPGPRVSVIIPCFNRSARLREAIESVLAQTYQDFEVLVIDDGSTDDTRTSLERRFAGDSRIHYFHKTHAGPGPARNLGLRNASGEFIAFLDSDDLWLPDKLEHQIRQLDEDPEAALSFTDAFERDASADGPTRFQSHGFRGAPTLKAVVEANFPLCTPAVVIRRSVLEETGMFDESLACAQDWDLWIRVLASHRAAYLERPSLVIRTGQDSISRTRVLEKWTCWLRIWEKHRDLLLRSGCSPAGIRSRLAHAHKKIAQACRSSGRYAEARSHYRDWWRCQPWQLRGLFWWAVLTLLPRGRESGTAVKD
jgi:glycosyltransferase involved in cell wall biosynthesis